METEKHAKPVGSFSLFKKSKNLILKNLNTFGLIFLVPFLIGLFTNIRSSRGSLGGSMSVASPGLGFSPAALGAGAFVGLIILVIYVIVSLMTYVLNLETAKGNKPTVSDLWPVVQKFGVRLVLLSIAITAVIILGLLALIVPGLIFIRRYYLAPYVMLDRDLSVGDAMKESARLSKPFSGSVWGIFGVMFLLSLPGIVPVVGWIVSFALTFFYSVAPALRYEELKKLTPLTSSN
ncbi:hypothetical protein BH10PAT3_BH10PAT3_3400 [soil metagenome]